MRNDDRIRASSSGTDSLGDGIRDQGYSRARVLVLVPFKCSAVRVVNAILDACPGAAGDISGYERFLEEFDVVDEVPNPFARAILINFLEIFYLDIATTITQIAISARQHINDTPHLDPLHSLCHVFTG
jgi:hypothetical protein